VHQTRWERLGAATGLAAVALTVLAYLVTPKAPDVDSPTTAVFIYFVRHQDAIHVGLALSAAALGAQLWFLASLRSAFAEAEGGQGRIASIVFGAGLAATVILFGELGTLAAAAAHPEETTPELTRALWDLGSLLVGGAAFAFAAVFAAAALGARRTRVRTRGLGQLAAAGAIASTLMVGRLFPDSGLFAADGLLGFVVPFVIYLVWTALASVQLIGRYQAPARRERRPRRATTDFSETTPQA
jgi:hypothetical protein